MSESSVIAIIVGVLLVTFTAVGMYLFRYEITGRRRPDSSRCAKCNAALRLDVIQRWACPNADDENTEAHTIMQVVQAAKPTT